MNILVVGAGPVGLTAAALFLKAGYEVHCIDCRKNTSSHSKEMVIDDSILMGLLTDLDLYSSFVRQGHSSKELSIFENRKIPFGQECSYRSKALIVETSFTS